MRQTTRTGEAPENNFVETATNDTHSCVEVSVTAKGFYQYAAKFYYASVDDLLAQAVEDVARFDAQFRQQFLVPKP